MVGLAVAERLARARGEVLLLERHERLGQGTSSRNSQVLHAGLYYPTGSLKAELCVRGNQRLASWCQAHGVPLRRVGKLIVATADAERSELEVLARRAEANGVAGVTALDASSVETLEPSVRAVAGLWVPSTGILDAHALVEALARSAANRGVTVALRHELRALERGPGGGWTLEVMGPGDRFRVDAEVVVNAAGLHADEVASLAGLDVDALGYRQHWVKGRYVRIRRDHAFSHLVYPVPPRELAGLGVHLTVGLDGDARLGPDVVPLMVRGEDYAVDEGCVVGFYEAARRFLPGLALEELGPDTAGIRPKLAPVGGGWRDFVVAEESGHGCPALVTLAGIESPGLTCCLELAERVAELLGLGGARAS